MASSGKSIHQPIRQISSWKVLFCFSLGSLLILLGVFFIPWDIKPVKAPDLQAQEVVPQVPEENAFTWFEQADRVLVKKYPNHSDESEQDWTMLASPIGAPLEKWDPDFATEILTANASVFPYLEKGLSCQCYVPPEKASLDTFSHWIRPPRQLTNLLCLKSKQAQLADKHAEAVHSALQAFRLGEMVVAGSRDNRDEWIIGIQIERLALRRLEELAADAKTSDAALMEILVCLNQSNSQGVVDSYKTGLRVEYTRFREPYIRNFIDGEYQDPGEPNWGLKTRAIPYFFKSNMTNRLIVASYRHQMARFDSPVYRIRNDDSDKLGLPNSALSRLEYLLKPNSQGKLFAYKLTCVFETDLLRKIRHQAYLSALRLKIAIRLYENEYGKLPNDLISLQPKFLKDIPRDPYIGQPFRYSKSAKTVWAVGSDLNDNDGKMKENERMCDYQNYDLVMPLVTRELIPNTKGFKPILPGPAQ